MNIGFLMGEAAKLLFGGHFFRDVDWWEIEAFSWEIQSRNFGRFLSGLTLGGHKLWVYLVWLIFGGVRSDAFRRCIFCAVLMAGVSGEQVH